MAAPSCKAPGQWVRGSKQRLGSLFSLVSKPFCSVAAASGTVSAQRLAEKLRAQKQEQKTKKQPVPTSPVQRRVQELVRFTQQLQRVHPNVLAKALSRGIVHQDKDLVVINKPYGLPVHGGPGVQLCITDVLPILAKMLHGHKAEPLHLCHRLDKETTGVMVLAWEKEVARQVQELFRTRQVAKKYWAITVRVPVPPAGVVDIPIIEKEVQVAVTQYRVLSSTLSSALVELQPITGIKHQLRVHLSFGLDCPILGDHKYSNWTQLAPQKLSLGTLKKLGLHQTKARHIPLHLHAHQLILPALGSRKEELDLVCKPPRYFVCSLRRLDLEMPSQDQNGDDKAGPVRAQ
ncbi:mitochondrial RNA pseudouridine synthase RPUSD4 isoform X3 [Neomonachus schauinslandi]|uniref:Pseudouridylate synthase RPUSD4, mitochondrial n=1 Tax=Neomonachus schauinslandi TaxID=29088 RepID=A0A2Y9HRT2_NEOSC|nr:mitochondrial RNA pseudouridine synthase RPUSD4 isoform X3 [Neomonachus schauinslandi]